ncbi:MAG: hypothetical protein ACRDT0_26940 [Pseudonocardiaceae bacterium]
MIGIGLLGGLLATGSGQDTGAAGDKGPPPSASTETPTSEPASPEQTRTADPTAEPTGGVAPPQASGGNDDSSGLATIITAIAGLISSIAGLVGAITGMLGLYRQRSVGTATGD